MNDPTKNIGHKQEMTGTVPLAAINMAGPGHNRTKNQFKIDILVGGNRKGTGSKLLFMIL